MLDRETEKLLWRDAVIVFDTCALGDIYSLAPETQQVFIEILTLLKDRMWIPAWVLGEFETHHDKFRFAPIGEQYGKLNGVIAKGKKYKADIADAMSDVKDDTFHPYIEPEACAQMEILYQTICDGIDDLEKKITEQKEKRAEEIRKAAETDTLYGLLKEVNHGDAFPMKALIQIVQEGQARYECKIPPGYKDAEDKEGLRKYGDLIIWKEILRYAALEKKSIILISDDVKEDWVIQESGPEEGDPRKELVGEFNDEVGLTFWKYTLSQMIEKLKEYFSAREISLPLYSKLDDVKNQLRLLAEFKKAHEKSKNRMILKCKSCGCEFMVAESEMYLDWEPNGSYERSMGEEREYEAVDSVSCPHCHRDIVVTMRVWEYPVGAFNYQSTATDGAEVIKEMDLYAAFDFNGENYGVCNECGEYKYIDPDKFGMCSDCYERKWHEAMKED